MCNLYSHTKGQAAIIALKRAMRDSTGNLPPQPGIFPDCSAPIVRNASDGVRELAMARWGMPSSAQALYQAVMRRADKLRAKGQEVDLPKMVYCPVIISNSLARSRVSAYSHVAASMRAMEPCPPA